MEKSTVTVPVSREEKQAAMQRSAVFKTPHYVVVVTTFTGGPTEVFEQMRTRYAIVSTDHGIILGNTTSLSQAIMVCLQEEATLIQALEIAEEAAARGYTLPAQAKTAAAGIGAPSF